MGASAFLEGLRSILECGVGLLPLEQDPALRGFLFAETQRVGRAGSRRGTKGSTMLWFTLFSQLFALRLLAIGSLGFFHHRKCGLSNRLWPTVSLFR